MVTETGRGGWRRPLFGGHEVGLGALAFALLGPPVAWSLHFGVIYFLVALYCTTGRTSVTVEVMVATVAFAAVSAWAGVVGYRRWRAIRGTQGWRGALVGGAGASTFLLIMGILGALYFTGLIVAEALPPLFVPACSEATG